MNLWGKVLYTFIEGMNKEKVVWYESNYNDVRNGTDGRHNQHREVETHLSSIKKAVENPNEVYKDKIKGKSLYYYGWCTGGMDYHNQHMKVVIRRTFFGKLNIVTAYFVENLLNKKEQKIWPKK